MKIIGFWCFIAQRKRQNTLNAMQKSQLFPMYRCWKNQEKPKKWKLLEKWSFLGVFLDYFSNGTLHRVKVFALQSVHSGASFKLSNTPNWWFSFFGLLLGFFSNFQTPRRGGPRDGGERGLKKNGFFFCIFLTSMYRSSDLAGSKLNFFLFSYLYPRRKPPT